MPDVERRAAVSKITSEFNIFRNAMRIKLNISSIDLISKRKDYFKIWNALNY